MGFEFMTCSLVKFMNTIIETKTVFNHTQKYFSECMRVEKINWKTLTVVPKKSLLTLPLGRKKWEEEGKKKIFVS